MKFNVVLWLVQGTTNPAFAIGDEDHENVHVCEFRRQVCGGVPLL